MTESVQWERVVQQYPSMADVAFHQFASLDSNVLTERQLTEREATQEVIKAVRR